ncbi:MAG TPA: peptide chain release factor N(5)-glutamine methyltransferase [Candidatus Omnitrophota bacterium]|nr:peptide chain release factor N(5)-glutamine methyltransferase [Candidatus Omnitrophota bacterium]HPD85036.1 peptide chain release factor N(5)-glutamine methyltransferase [Candidatus Omnitrophota bacterium]HRZ03894.1 peptide chain release factor N(5)-glutamine methyltransferase [Candidatus Omnitrophota bacterium]
MTEQELMLTSLLNCRRIDLYVGSKTLTPEQQNILTLMQERRKNGEPLQHILGSCEFMGLKFLTDKRALIPRPETEILVQLVIEKALSLSRFPLRILDIGTGSGNIAVSLVKNISNCLVTAVDISKEALDLARDNARLNQSEDKIRFIESDLFSYLSSYLALENLFDIIVSNPPYIPVAQIAHLPKEVRHDPVIALDGGEDGLDFYRRIADESPRFLRKGGFIFLEIGNGQRGDIENILCANGRFKIVDCVKDYNQTERVLIAKV